jgi:hypothetical protein
MASSDPRPILRNKTPESSDVALKADSRSSTTIATRPPAGARRLPMTVSGKNTKRTQRNVVENFRKR